VCDTVSGALGIVHFLVVLGAQVQVVVIGDQLGKSVGGFNDSISVLVEHFKKIALAGQKLAEQHD
jgi:hypothetical protein